MIVAALLLVFAAWALTLILGPSVRVVWSYRRELADHLFRPRNSD